MSKLPENLKYAKTHEWVRVEKDDTITVGITDHAQHSLGDLVFVELPNVGDQFNVGEQIGVVESVKAASDIYSPIAGEVIETNTVLADEPELVNQYPYENGWLFKLKPTENNGMENLLAVDQYAEIIASEE